MKRIIWCLYKPRFCGGNVALLSVFQLLVAELEGASGLRPPWQQIINPTRGAEHSLWQHI